MQLVYSRSALQRLQRRSLGLPNCRTPSLAPQRARTRLTCRAAKRASKKVSVEEPAPEDDEKKRRLDDLMGALNNKFGQGTIVRLNGTPFSATGTTPTGCLPLDLALGGGYPIGRVVEIFGPESSGKTTLALHAIAEAQRAGMTTVFIDAEHALDKTYVQALGIDVGSMLLVQPDCGEQALEISDQLARCGEIGMIVVDSVSALVPRAELEGEIGTVTVGAQARLMSSAMRKLCGSLSKGNTTMIFLNQIRMKVGVMYGNPEITSGGNALKYYSSVRIDIRKKDTITGDKGEVVGIKVKAKVVKNKVGVPHRETFFDIRFGTGIDEIASLFDLAEKSEVIVRRGSFCYFGNEKISQGRDSALVRIRESLDLQRQLKEAIKAKPPVDEVKLPEDENEGEAMDSDPLAPFDDGPGFEPEQDGPPAI